MDGYINQSSEQIARDNIDKQLYAAGWAVQDKKKIDWNESIGIAIRGYQTDVGPTDYTLFLERRPVGIVEAKKENEGCRLTSHESQAEFYAKSKLKYIDNDPLPFVYESTGILTRFTDYRDPKPRSRPVFTFHRPETFKAWLKEGKSLRARLLDIPGLPEFGLRNCQIKAKEYVDKRERLSRKKRWEQLDEDVSYSKKDLDKDIVNPSQIRNIIRAFKNKLLEIFPGRKEVPKTLIFAKTDSHADDIIQIVREEFNEGNEFCKKITYKTKDEDPKSVLNQFRTGYNPRIAVTVAMISVGIDVKPLECLLFMRDVKSRRPVHFTCRAPCQTGKTTY